MDCDRTYERLAMATTGDLPAARMVELRDHVAACASCARRLADLREVDAVLAVAGREQPPARAVLATRRALLKECGARGEPEVLTLAEVAEFLRVDAKSLGEVMEELPAFELAGQVRVRRAALMAWIARRENEFVQQSAASWVSGALVYEFEEGAA